MKTKTNVILIVAALAVYWVGLCNASAFYNPGTQRWLNRDPIQEQGGINFYGFVVNNPVGRIDALGETPWDWIPLIGTWLAHHNQPKGSKIGDYSYKMPCPCDDSDVAICENAINVQAFNYTVSANTPSAIGAALEYVGAFIGLGKGIPLTIVSGILALDGTAKVAIAVDNQSKISKAATEAKTQLCKCQTK